MDQTDHPKDQTAHCNFLSNMKQPSAPPPSKRILKLILTPPQPQVE